MQLIEQSVLLGYVIATDSERNMVMYFAANATFSNEIIAALRYEFDGWGILLCDEPNTAKRFLNHYSGSNFTEQIAQNDEVAHAINCVSAEYI